MMNVRKKMERKRSGWLRGVAAVFAAALLVAGCGDDDGPSDPPKDYGISPVTFLHANPGRDGEVAFFRGETTRVGSDALAYGETFKVSVPNGENLNYMVKSLSGQTLTSTTGAHDSSQYAMVIYTGDATTDESFVVSTNKINPNTGNVAVRFIHAAKDAGTRSLHINDSTGAVVATNLAYKGGSETYVSVPILGTSRFWIVDPTHSTPAIEVPVNLAFGSAWTIVFHGSRSAITEELEWMGTPIADE